MAIKLTPQPHMLLDGMRGNWQPCTMQQPIATGRLIHAMVTGTMQGTTKSTQLQSATGCSGPAPPPESCRRAQSQRHPGALLPAHVQPHPATAPCRSCTAVASSSAESAAPAAHFLFFEGGAPPLLAPVLRLLPAPPLLSPVTLEPPPPPVVAFLLLFLSGPSLSSSLSSF